jgi:hypothetical protein
MTKASQPNLTVSEAASAIHELVKRARERPLPIRSRQLFPGRVAQAVRKGDLRRVPHELTVQRGGQVSPLRGMYEGDTVSNSVDNRPQEASDLGSAVRTSMLLVGVLVAGVSLLHLPTSLMSQANTQVEAGPPIVKASDKWIRLGVDASSSQVPTALDQPPAMSW